METYYQLIDRETLSISVWWKVLHLLWFAIVIISGFITAHSFGKALEYFGNHCILFAKIYVETSETIATGGKRFNTTAIDFLNVEWGDQDVCYFCQFTPIICMITAIVWGSFFFLLARGGAGYISDTVYGGWKLVYPALLFSIVATITMFISTSKLHGGIIQFCSIFEEIFNTTRCAKQINKYTLTFSNTEKDIMGALEVALYCSYICCGAWVLQFTTLILRIINIVDFDVIQITVTPIGEETEMNTTDPDADSFNITETLFTDIWLRKTKKDQLLTPSKSKLRPNKRIIPDDDDDEFNGYEMKTSDFFASPAKIEPKKKDESGTSAARDMYKKDEFYVHEMYKKDESATSVAPDMYKRDESGMLVSRETYKKDGSGMLVARPPKRTSFAIDKDFKTPAVSSTHIKKKKRSKEHK